MVATTLPVPVKDRGEHQVVLALPVPMVEEVGAAVVVVSMLVMREVLEAPVRNGMLPMARAEAAVAAEPNRVQIPLVRVPREARMAEAVVGLRSLMQQHKVVAPVRRGSSS